MKSLLVILALLVPQIAWGQEPNVMFKTLTFSPTVYGSGTPGTPTYTVQAGNYIIIGEYVFYNIRLVWTAISGSPTGSLRIGGLPKTARGNSTYSFASSYFSNITMPASTLYASCAPEFSQTFMFCTNVKDGVSGAEIAIDTAGEVAISGHYQF